MSWGGGGPVAGGRRRGGAVRRVAAFAVVGLGVVGGLAGCGPADEFQPDDPRSAVSQLLNAAIGQANGQRACSLLTPAARKRLDAGAAGSCRQALNASVSSMPGPFSASDDAGRATTNLIFDVVSQSQDRAVVTARRGENPALKFDVVRLSPDELAEDTAASQDTAGGSVTTDWRVAGGEQQLVETDDPTAGSPAAPAPGTTTSP